MIATAGNSNPALAKAVADILKLPLSDATVGRYADGEVSIKVTSGGCAPLPL